jgi:D-alanine-D-alanine ligase
MNKKIIILSGGFSEEKEVSKVSASEIEKALRSKEYETYLLDPSDYSSWSILISEILKIKAEIVFNGLHGAEGENGSLQALFDLHGIQYTGSGCRASALAMDKIISAKLAESLGIMVPEKIVLWNRKKPDLRQVHEKMRYPCIVKPNDSGSSVGISLVLKENELEKAVKEAFNYSNMVLCEQFIPGRELTVTILGQKALPVVEIIPRKGWYDYNNKYTSGNTVYKTPAPLPSEETENIQNSAIRIFELFGCKAYARVDYRFDGDNFYFLELNTLPGMTPLSLTPMAAKAAGLNFAELLEKIIFFS